MNCSKGVARSEKLYERRKRIKRVYWKNWGRASTLTSVSKIEKIIADWMEQGLGFRWTTMMLNHYRREMWHDIVDRNAVIYTFHRMAPTTIMIKKRIQGSFMHDAWQTTRYRQTKQINIMLGRISIENLHLEFTDNPIIPKPILN